MTNEQLTQEVMKLAEHQAKCDSERENMLLMIEEIKENVKETKSLTEDVHILAMNIKNMQETLDETNKKVDALTSKEFIEYKENKKVVKSNVISAFAGAICTGVLAIFYWIIKEFVSRGG